MNEPKKLYRVKEGQIIAGVATGLARYFNVDTVLVRVVFIALVFAGGSGVLLYIILAIIIPEEPKSTTSHTSSTNHEVNSDTVKEFVNSVGDNAQKIAEDIKERINQNTSTNSQGETEKQNTTRNIVAMVIIAVGVLALFNSITGFHLFRWELFWPIVLIFIGGIILFKKGH